MLTNTRGILIVVLGALALMPQSAAAQKHCLAPRFESGCCACIFGTPSGFQDCLPSCSGGGVCTVMGDCSITLQDLRLAPDGSVMPPSSRISVTMAVNVGQSPVDDPAPSHWQGVSRIRIRNCLGYVIARTYSSDAINEVRARSKRIVI